MRRFSGWPAILVVIAAVAAMWIGQPLRAQDPNACDEPGESPDVIVGDLHQVQRYGTLNGITAFAVGTVSCNIGTCWLNWISNTNEHPVIGQSMYRLKDGRYEQIGQSWLKHGFFALSGDVCTTGCISTNGSHLGVNCSDPYSAGLNGQQSGLGPKSEVNPSTGEYPYPFTTSGMTGDVLYKRLQVHNEDLDPALNPGARYFVEGHYITGDDTAAGNDANNASHREITVTGTDPDFDISLIGETERQLAGVQAWALAQAGVKETLFVVPEDGRFIGAASVTDLGGGIWHYEYAIQNLNSHRAAQSFRVRVPGGSIVSNIGFHDVDYHSGEPYDGTDWVGVHDSVLNQVIWSTDTFDENPDANALRWGTTYNFRFDTDAPPVFAPVTIGLFLPGTPLETSSTMYSPNVCNSNGVCEAGETCSNCAADCINTGPSIGVCGDGVCEPTIGEDCVSCPSDCAGRQNGNPNNRYCCGDGDGQGPVGCADARCNSGGFTCGITGDPVCCGDGSCDPGEDSCVCAADCGPPPAAESICDDGVDEDCDGQADCGDLDCCTDALCADGIDADADGVAECDCDDGDDQIWDTPGEVLDLNLDEDAVDGTILTWNPPLDPGSVTLEYETLRAELSVDFGPGASCVLLPDPTQTTGTDPQNPAAGTVFYYLVRARNGCPDGEGPLGVDSSAAERPGRTCP